MIWGLIGKGLLVGAGYLLGKKVAEEKSKRPTMRDIIGETVQRAANKVAELQEMALAMADELSKARQSQDGPDSPPSMQSILMEVLQEMAQEGIEPRESEVAERVQAKLEALRGDPVAEFRGKGCDCPPEDKEHE
jgi:hypothetical protein